MKAIRKIIPTLMIKNYQIKKAAGIDDQRFFDSRGKKMLGISI